MTSRHSYTRNIKGCHVITLDPLSQEQTKYLIGMFLDNHFGNTINEEYKNSLISTMNLTSIMTPRESIAVSGLQRTRCGASGLIYSY